VSERLPVTLMISTFRAVEDLRGCIESCSDWVSEVLVVDMGSDDGTIELAQELGARVLPVPPAGFAEPGRQAGIDAASQPWLLVLDADERAGAGLRALVAASVARADLDGVRLNRENHIFGRPIHSAGFWPDYQLRLFRQGKTHWPPYTHTQAVVDGTVEDGPMEPSIVHYAYDSIAEWVNRGNRYTDHDLVRYAEKGRTASLPRLLVMPPARFAWHYVVKRGYRDGRHGLVLSLLLAWYAAMIEMKLWDQERRGG
jgi:glycosyltransferase involved in cell wall biosynthesis